MRQSQNQRAFVRLTLALSLAAVGALFSGSSLAHAADQLVAFDEVFTVIQKGDGGLEPYHHRIDPKPAEPDSWITPVDYAHGTAYIYMEVQKKPSQKKTIMTVCFDGERSRYGCIDTLPYTGVGTVKTMSPMAEGGLFWQWNKIDWAMRRGQYHIVVKDPSLGGQPGGNPASDYTPTTMRMVLTVVPPGGTYVPPTSMAATPDAGAATADAATGGEDASVTADAPAVEPDAASGTGGSGGTGNGGTAGTGESGGSGGSSAGTGGSSAGGSGGSKSGTGGTSGGSTVGGKPYTTPPPSGGSKSGGGSSQDSSASCTVAGPSARTSGSGLALLLFGFTAAFARLRRRQP